MTFPSERPTQVRYSMIALTTLVAIMLYLDRVCLGILNAEIRPALELTSKEYGRLLSAFFWAYAIFQLPAGWLGDRYGPRSILAIYLFLWSLCTGLMGLATGFGTFLILRLGCGMFEAGAYPLAAGIVRRWMPLRSRGLASGCVSVGGRLGGAIAPALTVWLASGSVDGWRRPFMVYGVVGMIGAVIFWAWFRNRPSEHPAVNPAEADLINSGNVVLETNRVGLPPFRAMIASRALWMSSFVQMMSNFVWVFLITLMPTYLDEAFNIPVKERANLQSIPLYAGIFGMLLGGWLTDLAAKRFGMRWGRALPIAGSRLIVGGAYLACVGLHDPIAVIVLLAVVAMSTDMGVAPVWAFGQDVGGRHVGAIVGWANMWGNFGAALGTEILLGVRSLYSYEPTSGWTSDSIARKISEGLNPFVDLGVDASKFGGAFAASDFSAGWGMAFLVCAGSQLLAAIAALGIDASKPIQHREETRESQTR